MMIRYRCNRCGRIYTGWSDSLKCTICNGDLNEEKDCDGQRQEGK
jgi:rRNA maturation endonuclease Nob1